MLKEKVMNATPATPAKTHDGKVVSVAGDKLTTTCSEGKAHCHTSPRTPR